MVHLSPFTGLPALQRCAKRVDSDETGEAHCTGQYFDYWKCVDKCVRFLTYMLLCPVLAINAQRQHENAR